MTSTSNSNSKNNDINKSGVINGIDRLLRYIASFAVNIPLAIGYWVIEGEYELLNYVLDEYIEFSIGLYQNVNWFVHSLYQSFGWIVDYIFNRDALDPQGVDANNIPLHYENEHLQQHRTRNNTTTSYSSLFSKAAFSEFIDDALWISPLSMLSKFIDDAIPDKLVDDIFNFNLYDAFPDLSLLGLRMADGPTRDKYI